MTGLLGPVSDLLRALIARARPLPTDADVAAAGRGALAEAERLWREDIIDPKRGDHSAEGEHGRAMIDLMIRGILGLSWSWEQPYDHDGQFAWCGAFAARCHAGSIPLAIRRRYFASTYRLDRWARYRPVDERDRNARPKGAPDRLLAVLDEHSTGLPAGVVPQPGDVLLVGPVPGGHVLSCGAHVTLVESYDAGARVFHTIAGNGTGAGPKGDTRQGVVRAKFTVGGRIGHYHARRLIRPIGADIAG